MKRQNECSWICALARGAVPVGTCVDRQSGVRKEGIRTRLVRQLLPARTHASTKAHQASGRRGGARGRGRSQKTETENLLEHCAQLRRARFPRILSFLCSSCFLPYVSSRIISIRREKDEGVRFHLRLFGNSGHSCGNIVKECGNK